MVDKVEGAEQNCGSCGVHLTCRRITYNGADKLQWQTDENQSHFKFDPSTKKAYCPNVVPTSGTGEQITQISGTAQSTITKGIDFDALNDINRRISNATKALKAFIKVLKEEGAEGGVINCASVFNTELMRK